MKLTKRDIRQWVKALRSGEYKQTQEVLCREILEDDEREFSFCCLGVACDLFLDGYWQRDEKDFSADKRWIIDGQPQMPPFSLRNAINEALPSLANKNMNEWDDKSDNACEFLACKNDDGRSFKQIANIIERAAGLAK